MQFFKPLRLLILSIIPCILFFTLLVRITKVKRYTLFASPVTYSKINKNVSRKRQKIKYLLYLAALTFLCLAFAQPQWGHEKKTIKRKGVDVMIVLDVSKSMLVEDIKPNRLQKAKIQIRKLVDRLEGDRIGLVIFTGSSYLVCPLTLDYNAFELFLHAASVGDLPLEGTAISEALLKTLSFFDENDAKHQLLILFSDGEDHAGDINHVADVINERGIKVYAIGMGTEKGGLIPLAHDNHGTVQYQKDKEGKTIISALNDRTLKTIASETGGLYLKATPSDKEIGILSTYIAKLEKKEFQEQLITEKEDQFQIFVLAAFVLLCIELIIGDKRKVINDA